MSTAARSRSLRGPWSVDWPRFAQFLARLVTNARSHILHQALDFSASATRGLPVNGTPILVLRKAHARGSCSICCSSRGFRLDFLGAQSVSDLSPVFADRPGPDRGLCRAAP